MIRAGSGERPNVTGSSIAMVAIGPMPGSTPISVPIRQPNRQKPRLTGVTAAPKPVARFCTSSIRTPRSERLTEHLDEQHDAEQCEAERQRQRLDWAHPRLANAAVMVTATTASASPSRSMVSANTTIDARMNSCGHSRLRSMAGPSIASARATRTPPTRSSAQLSTAGR